MKRLALVLLILIIIVSCGCAVHTETVKQDVETIDELKTILGELDDETVKNTVQELLDVPVDISRMCLEIKGVNDTRIIVNQEIAPYMNDIPIEVGYYLLPGMYIRYGCKYSEECDNGSAKVHHISVFVEVDKEGEFLLPLHLYAYDRVCEKRTGILETYTAPEWTNSIKVVGVRK